MKIEFGKLVEGPGYSNLVEITSEDNRSYLTINFNPVLLFGVNCVYLNLFNISFMRDICIPGFEFNITLPLISIYFRRNFPQADAVIEEIKQKVSEMKE
jgi:hypothetical protein